MCHFFRIQEFSDIHTLVKSVFLDTVCITDPQSVSVLVLPPPICLSHSGFNHWFHLLSVCLPDSRSTFPSDQQCIHLAHSLSVGLRLSDSL